MKGQVKIQQTAFMLIALTILFVMVGMFFLSFQLSGIKKTVSELDAQNALLLATKLAETPEFSCGESYGGQRMNCIDLDKVSVLYQNIEKYKNFWGVSNIEIKKLNSEEAILCNNENYPDCNGFRLLSEEIIGTDASIFVSLCRKDSANLEAYDKCELGILMISYEKK